MISIEEDPAYSRDSSAIVAAGQRSFILHSLYRQKPLVHAVM